jgi:hypothetical protein
VHTPEELPASNPACCSRCLRIWPESLPRSNMFEELRALADQHAELHADRARLQAELEQARRPWWWQVAPAYAGPEGPTMRDRTVAYFPQYCGASFQAAAKRSEVRSRHGDWKRLPSGTMRARRRLSRNSQAMAAPPLASVFPAV